MAVVTQYRVKPAIDATRTGVWLGSGKSGGDGIWLGTLAEAVAGKQPQVWLATDKEQVVAVVGKRGSGKSFTLGVLIEGLVGGVHSPLAEQESARAVLVFDPLDIYWTTRFPVGPSDNEEAQRHFQLARSAGLPVLDYDVEAWIPGSGTRRPIDPAWFRTLQLSVPAMGLEEWELILDVNIMSEPMGQAFADVRLLVSEQGYRIRGEEHPASAAFDIDTLVHALGSDELGGTYHQESLRAVRQRLTALAGTGLFSATGTAIADLLAPGRACVILLGRLPHSYRSAVVAVLTRMLIDQRASAAFAEKRLALDPDLQGDERTRVQNAATQGIPRTVVVLDEAQAFLAPGRQSPARDLFVRLVKEGRNMGLSAVLATQQPSALDTRVLSQVETFVAHQLVTEPDIRAVRDNLKSPLPDSVAFGAHQLDTGALLRQLTAGTCLVSAADMNTTIRRSILIAVRPRATVHGGIEL
jgi:hypothetical protein